MHVSVFIVSFFLLFKNFHFIDGFVKCLQGVMQLFSKKAATDEKNLPLYRLFCGLNISCYLCKYMFVWRLCEGIVVWACWLLLHTHAHLHTYLQSSLSRIGDYFASFRENFFCLPSLQSNACTLGCSFSFTIHFLHAWCIMDCVMCAYLFPRNITLPHLEKKIK